MRNGLPGKPNTLRSPDSHCKAPTLIFRTTAGAAHSSLEKFTDITTPTPQLQPHRRATRCSRPGEPFARPQDGCSSASCGNPAPWLANMPPPRPPLLSRPQHQPASTPRQPQARKKLPPSRQRKWSFRGLCQDSRQRRVQPRPPRSPQPRPPRRPQPPRRRRRLRLSNSNTPLPTCPRS